MNVNDPEGSCFQFPCKGTLRWKQTDYTLSIPSGERTFKDLWILQCDSCGDIVIPPEAGRIIDNELYPK